MIPGPTEVDPEVLSALSKPVLPHYGPEWGRFFNETRAKIGKIFDTSGDVIILPTPANVALEIATLNLVRKGGTVLNLSNGFFGEMTKEILEMSGRNPLNLCAEPGIAIDPAKVEEALEGNSEIEAVFLVHNETSTGVLNPLEEIGRIVHEHSALFVVDSVSAFGGSELAVDDWHIDFCIGYASKCLSSVNGVVPISISGDAWEEAFRKRNEVPRFFNLRVWRRFEEEWGSWGHPYPSSMPTSIIVALNAAVDKALNEGLAVRYARHRAVGRALREAMRAVGLESLPEEEVASSTLSVIEVPPGTDKMIRKTLRDEFDIMVAGGLSELRGRVLRIGHMGVTASRRCVIPTIRAIEVALNRLGLLDSLEAGVEVAERILAEQTVSALD